jgi:hypothetical protein
VLKDGEIIESGSHKSLLAADGVFAAMWAEQVSTENDGLRLDIPSAERKVPSGYEIPLTAGPKAPIDITETPVGREAMLPTEPPGSSFAGPGLVVPPADIIEPKVEAKEDVQAPAEGLNVAAQGPLTESVIPEPGVVAEETGPESSAEAVPEQKPAEGGPSYAAVAATEPTSESSAAIAFPSSPEAPVAFPSDNRSITQEPGTATPIPGDHGADTASVTTSTAAAGITFSPAATSSRPQTPEAGEKRKRTASQNLQRLARRMSLGGRRSSVQAAEAAKAAQISLSESPKPIESLVNKLTGRGSSSRDDGGSVKSGSIKVGSVKGDDETPSDIPGEEAAEATSPDAGAGTTSKKNKKSKKSKK